MIISIKCLSINVKYYLHYPEYTKLTFLLSKNIHINISYRNRCIYDKRIIIISFIYAHKNRFSSKKKAGKLIFKLFTRALSNKHTKKTQL